MSKKRITIFDSGAGGLSIARAMIAANLDITLSYGADSAFFPYGEKKDDDLIARLPPLLAKLADESAADLLVIACNTASTIALDLIRRAVNVPVIGVVPAIKPAASLTKTGTIGLLATPRTIARPYTDDLIAQYAAGVKVLRHGPPDLALAAEDFLSTGMADLAVTERALAGLLGQEGGAHMDVVVLACTHYPFLAEQLAQAAQNILPNGRDIQFIDSAQAIVRRAKTLLSLAETGENKADLGPFFTTGGATAAITNIAQRFGFSDIHALY